MGIVIHSKWRVQCCALRGVVDPDVWPIGGVDDSKGEVSIRSPANPGGSAKVRKDAMGEKAERPLNIYRVEVRHEEKAACVLMPVSEGGV